MIQCYELITCQILIPVMSDVGIPKLYLPDSLLQDFRPAIVHRVQSSQDTDPPVIHAFATSDKFKRSEEAE